MQTRAIALLVLVTLVVFGGSLVGGFVWDDPSLILRDTRSFTELFTTGFWAGSGASVAQDFYRPAVSAAFWLQRAAFGEGAFGYHLVSVLLHLACVVLAWRWLQRRVGNAVVPVLLGALLFALHPSRVESVAWISGSTDLWLTFWLLLGFEARASRRTVLAAVFWLLAALSKETGILVPLLVAADHFLLERKSGLRPLVPAVLAATVALVVRAAVVASPPVDGLLTGGTVARVLASTGYYARSALWPWTPTVTVGAIDPAAEGAWLLPTWAIALGAVVLLAFVALVVASTRRPTLRPWLADAAWLVVPILPVLNLVPLGYQTFVAERFLYLPLLGLCAIVARLLSAVSPSQLAFRAAAAAVCVLAFACAGASTMHVARFFDDVELWSYEREIHPDDPRVGKWLAQAQQRAGMFDEAKAAVLTAMEQAPPAWTVLRAELAVEWGVLESLSGPDAEQERLLAARTLLDTLAEPPAAETVTVAIGGKRYELVLDERVRARLASDKPLRDHRILAHLRTLGLERAAALAARLGRETQQPAYVANHALVLLAAERWSEAERLLAGAAAAGDARISRMRDELGSFRQRLATASGHEAVVLRATFLKDQGLRTAARRALADSLADMPSEPSLIELAVRIDLEDGVPHLARQRLERLSAEAPTDHWRRMLGEVDAWEQRAVATGE